MSFDNTIFIPTAHGHKIFRDNAFVSVGSILRMTAIIDGDLMRFCEPWIITYDEHRMLLGSHGTYTEHQEIKNCSWLGFSWLVWQEDWDPKALWRTEDRPGVGCFYSCFEMKVCEEGSVAVF